MNATIRKIRRKIRRVPVRLAEVGGVRHLILGEVKRRRYKKLCEKYNVDEWHQSPYELRQYAQETVKYVNATDPAVVVEVGCGFGEVLRRTLAPKRYGFDIMPQQIEVARLLAKREDITYQVGSFDDVNLQEPIDFLIAQNFMHIKASEAWRDTLHGVAERNDIRHFVVSTIPEGMYGSAHYIDYSKVLPDNYKLVDRLGPFRNGCHVEIYQKTAQN